MSTVDEKNLRWVLYRTVLVVFVAESAADEEDEEDALEQIYITGLAIPYSGYELTGWILGQVQIDM